MLSVSRYNVYFHDHKPQKTLVFNTLSKGIAILDSHLARSLEEVSAAGRRDLPRLAPRERESLVRAGFLVSHELDERKQVLFRRNFARFASRRMAMTVFFTTRCNFTCTYCYQDLTTSPEDMAIDDWGGVYSYVAEQVAKRGIRTLHALLFGGEPLLNAAVVVRAAEQLKALEETGVRVTLYMPTNGSLLDAELAQRLSPLVDRVQITLDGPASRHNRLRPYADGSPSYQQAMRGIRLCIDHGVAQIVLRINFTLAAVAEVGEFIRSAPFPPKERSRIFMSPAAIAPPLSVAWGKCDARGTETSEAPHGLLDSPGFGRTIEEHKAAVSLLLEANELGYPLRPFSFSEGQCQASMAATIIVDQNLDVHRCLLQVPGRACARLHRNGTLVVTDDSWYDLATWNPECITECTYGPICSGGCPVVPSRDVGGETCLRKAMFEATLEDVLQVHMLANSTS